MIVTAFGCRGNTIRLKSGEYLDLANPLPDAIRLEDIGAGLAKVCRFGGQVDRFYSVAQHSVCCDDVAAQWGYTVEQRRAVILHDASEAYVGDVVKPLKIMLPAYKEIEDRVMAAIGERFGVDFAEHEQAIKAVDHAMLIHERNQLYTRVDRDSWMWAGEDSVRPIDMRIIPWHWARAEELFMGRARTLGCR